ncbi:hypothetical protein [Deinococcus yavapaiensis]|nr:hypothetical protein [Deinococcus yavapaiensis]
MTMSLDHVNGMFGLTPQQIEALEESQRLAVQTAIARLVDSAVGKYLTKELIDVVQRRSGVTTATKHAAKYLPVVNGAVGYGTFVVTCDRHILECEQVVRAVWASRRNGAREA